MFLRYQVLAYISMYVLFFWLHHFNCKYLTFEKKNLFFFAPFKSINMTTVYGKL